MRPRLRSLLNYLFAAGVTAAAVAMRLLLEPLWQQNAPFVLLFPAVFASAWLGGLGPGLLATALAALAAFYFWFAPYGRFAIPLPGDAMQMVAFVAASVGLVWMTDALLRARSRLDALLDANPVGLGLHDTDLRYIRVNRALAEINGRPAAEHVGRTCREILGDAAADTVEPILKDVLRTGRAVHVPALTVRLAGIGAERSYSVSYAPARDATGAVSGVAVAVSDVTDIQRAHDALQHEREVLRAVIDGIPVMITMYGPGTAVPRVNREFERVTGWTAADVESDEFMPACFPESAYRAMVREYLRSPRPGWRDVKMVTKGGAVVETSWSIIRLSDGSRVGIGLDVTERRRYEAEMRTAREAAERASRAKDEFIAMLGHELRNPLSAIAGAVAVLQRAGADEPRAAAARDVIGRQTQHLARLMDDLLDAGRVMTGKIVLDRHPLDVLEVAERVVATLLATGRAARHRLTVAGTPAWIDGDATRVEQIITNLVGNALKFTPPGGAISVAVGDDGREAIVRVSDTGHGIAADMLPRIFDLFVQGEQAADRAQGGLGIGLTLVRRLAELHGGRVEAASAGPGTGSTFTVHFPRLPAPRPASEPPARRVVPRQRTLVVEDNDDAREMLRTLLELDGHTVYEAANGIAALASALEHRPDIAIIDIGLPEMDGHEVARRLRASESLKDIKLIALTGYGQPDDARRAHEAGFDLYIVKPVEPERLAEALATVVTGDAGPALTAPPGAIA